MRVRFVDQFDYRPSGDPRVIVVYRPDGGVEKDGVYTVKRECGCEAISSGRAVLVRAPRGAGVSRREPGSRGEG
jgi:hypothetical protein